MTILVLGAAGQIGREVIERAGSRAVGMIHADCDIRDPDQVARSLTLPGLSLIVNCAGYTAVDRAESEGEIAFSINAEGAEIVAIRAATIEVPIIYLSTDYVFSGDGTRARREDDPVAPLNVYGRSKAAGEQAVVAANPRHIILRVSWVFGTYGTNFVKTMLRLGMERDQLRVVNDQIGGPTEARDIADAILAIAACCNEPKFSGWGTYHFAGAPAATWFEFARAIFERNGRTVPELTPIKSEEYPTPARRPRNSILDCDKINTVFGLHQPDWRLSLSRVLTTLNEARR